MKALVTGAAGFVGRNLVAALREDGWQVVSTDRHPPVDLQGDLLDLPLGRVRVDVVFHLSGFAHPTASIDHPEDAFRGNASATARVVREVRARRYILASSCQVYGSRPELCTEETPVAPRTPYSASKLCAEALALASGKDVVVLRPFNHTGPGQSPRYVCPRIARQIALAEAGRGPRRIELGALLPRRDFFDVRDMVRAYLLAARKARAGEIYNVGTGRPLAIRSIAERMMSLSRAPLRLAGLPGEADVLSGDASKFRNATGWTPEIDFSTTLRDLLDDARARVRSPE